VPLLRIKLLGTVIARKLFNKFGYKVRVMDLEHGPNG